MGNNKPKVKHSPPHRTPTHTEKPEAFDHKQIRFRFDLLDFEHSLWGWDKLSNEQLIQVLQFFKSFEKQTWAEIKQTVGGRKRGTNHHSIEIAKFDKKVRDRLTELQLDRTLGDIFFSFRINNCTRIYGHRADQFFHIIWYDPYHGSANQAYPLQKK